MTDLSKPAANAAPAALADLRRRAPLVQCITNYVAMNPVANIVLAVGGVPAMVHDAAEAGDFAAQADALTVNIGTLSPDWVAGMTAAIKAATAASKPWVLDPVAHFATPYRAGVAADLVLLQPTILRGNASEVLAFTGAESAGRGVEAGDPVSAAVGGAKALASRMGGVVVVTGPQDYITDGERAALVTGGSPLMGQVTAIGCALTGVLGAFAAVSADPMDGAIAACLLFAIAGERAAQAAAGPGSFGWQFADALAAVHPEDLTPDRVEVL